MPTDYKHLIESHILDEATFVQATLSGQQRGQTVPWKKVILRPVLVKNKRHLQFSYFDGQKDISKNYLGADLINKVGELLALPFKNIHLHSTRENIHVQITKKGKVIIHRHQVSDQPTELDLTHDRRKNLLLPDGKPDPFLQTIGIMTKAGQVKADRRDKFRQINEFLKLVSQTIDEKALEPPVKIIDCGCGNAYLTFAIYHYFNHTLGLPTRMIGVDVKKDLLKRRAEQAQALGWRDLTFQAAKIIDFQPAVSPDIVLALHACDTATDEALAQAIKWQSKFIFSVPCCHHHLQGQLQAQPPFEPVFRHGILKEQLGDILTDSFRALILRLMGYRTDVFTFVSVEHTAKNLMIRAVKTVSPGDSSFVQEYEALKSFWKVTPYLETLLGDDLNILLKSKPR